MKKITIIPARSGSKGVPNKNILKLGGVPMFAWSILHAKHYSCKNDKIYVSSDSEEYLEIAIKFGAIPHKRSPSLAKDSTKTEPVMEEILSTLEIDDEDLIILLQPTSPIRKKETLDKLISAFDDQECDSAITLSRFHGFLWEDQNKYKKPLYNERLRRQDMEPRYTETGSVYITKAKQYKETSNRISGNIKGIQVTFEESLEVDTIEEFEVIKAYFENHAIDWDIEK